MDGNPRLRQMGAGRARDLCKLALRDDPKAKAAYDEWCDAYEEQKRTMGEAYRAVGKGGHLPSRQSN